MTMMSGTRTSITFLNTNSLMVAAHHSAEVISGASRFFLMGSIALSMARSNLSAVTTWMYQLRKLFVILVSFGTNTPPLLSSQVICFVPNDCVKISLSVILRFCGSIGLATNCVIGLDL